MFGGEPAESRDSNEAGDQEVDGAGDLEETLGESHRSRAKRAGNVDGEHP